MSKLVPFIFFIATVVATYHGSDWALLTTPLFIITLGMSSKAYKETDPNKPARRYHIKSLFD